MTKKIVCFFVLSVMLILSFSVPVFADTDDETEALPGITFIAGDVNLDKKVNIKDVTAIQRYLAKIITLSVGQKRAADVDGEDGLNIKDATHLQKWLAHITDELYGIKVNRGTTGTSNGGGIVLPFVPA